MSEFSKALNEYFYAWGDNDPEKTVLRYGKIVSLRLLHGYDDYKYYRPRRQMAGQVIILGTLAGGYCLYKGGNYLKSKYAKIEKKKESLKFSKVR